MGFHTIRHKQTVGAHVADSCQEESYSRMMPKTPGLNHFLFASWARAALWRMSDLHVQDLVNSGWKFVAGDQSDAQLLVLARAGLSCVSNFNVQQPCQQKHERLG